MGAVYLAHDAVLDRPVALKRAQRDESHDLLRFKREFRAIERLTHPNLVRLYELGSDDAGLYYTMEAIEGEDLATYCRRGDPTSRLAEVLPQLLDALAFLHAHGVVHCDLKPTNVLVTAAGELTLLDFGVLAELSRGASERTVAGTPAYLAPERIRGEPATPATDLYALGCTLFEIFAGRPPFVGSVTAVLAAHLAAPVPDGEELGVTIPPDFDMLTRALMAKEPADRPPIDRLRAGRAGWGGEVELVGRDALKRHITECLEKDRRPVVLSGPSGVGKSTLLEWLARDARRAGALVFSSAARSTERLTYNALDAAMDDLARVLHASERATSHRAQRIAAEAFPLLRPCSPSLDDARERVRERLFGFREALEACSRREVFDAIASLFDSATEDRGGLLVVDDFQWADADAVALMSHLLGRAAKTLRVALVVRSDVEPTLAHAWLDSVGAAIIEVPPLALEDAARVVRRAAAELGATIEDDALRAAARACEGRPFLAEVAGRALASGAPSTLEEQLGAAWAREGELLSLLVTEDGWTPVTMLASLLGRSLGSLELPLGQLEQAGLVRRSGGALDGRADLYHDGVRRAALARLAPGERAALHARVADHLLGLRDAPPARLVHHLASAGRSLEAAHHARRAAAQAERQRAFSAAADMYAIVLASEPADRAAREARAEALERSSRYAEAAEEWAALTVGAPHDERLDLGLHEAHSLIAASRTAEGIRRLDAALAASGQGPVRVRGLRAVATAARFLIGPITSARASVRDPSSRRRAERNLKIGILLAFLDPFTGISFLQRARADFLRAGADAQVAGCDWMFAILSLVGSHDPDRVPLAERYLAAARRRARGLELPPDVRGMSPFVEALRLMRQGRWTPARARFEEATAVFRESTTTTELTLARSFQLMMAAHMQDMRETRRQHDLIDRHADECGGTLGIVHTGLVGSYLTLLEGRFDEATEALMSTVEVFADSAPNAQHAALRLYTYCAEIYRDDCARARRELAIEVRRARPFRFLSTMHASCFAFIEALIEANALRAGDRDASPQRVDRLAAIGEAAPPLWAGGTWRARAYAADALGRPEDALCYLARAEEEAARFERNVDVAIARWQRGKRLGGDTGAELRASAEDLVRSLEVSPLMLQEDAGLR